MARRHHFPWRAMVVLGALALGARALLTTPSVNFAVDELSDRLRDELGIDLTIANLQTDPDTATLRAGPIVVKGSDGHVLLIVEHVVAELEPLRLFARHARLLRVELTRPRLSLNIKDGAVLGVRVPQELSAAGTDVRLDIANLFVQDGTIDITIDAGAASFGEMHLHGVNAGMHDGLTSGRSADEHAMAVRVAGGTVRGVSGRVDKTVALDAFSGELALIGRGLLQPSRAVLTNVTLSAAQTHVDLDATIDLAGARGGEVPPFIAHASARGELDAAVAGLDLPVAVAGSALLDITAHSERGGKDAGIEGTLEVTHLDIDTMALGTVRLRGAVTALGVDVQEGSWDIADTVVSATARVDFDDALTTTVTARANGFSIYALLTSLGFGHAWADATINANAQLAGTLRPLALVGEGNGSFPSVRVAARDVAPVRNSDLVLLTARPIAAEHIAIRVDDEGLLFSGTIDDSFTRAEGSFALFYDVQRGMIIDAHAQRADFASINNTIGNLNFSGAGAGHLHVEGPQSGPTLTAELALDDLTLEGYDFGAIAGKVLLKSSQVTFFDLDAHKSDDTALAGVVALDFNQPIDASLGVPPLLTVDVAFAPARAQQLRTIVAPSATGVMAFLRDDLDIAGPVVGHVNARGAVGDGNFRRITLEGQAQLLPGSTLLDQHLSGTLAFVLDRDALSLRSQDLVVAAGGGSLDLKVARDDGALSGHARITAAQLAHVDALKDASRRFFGGFDVDGEFTQTTDNPGFVGRAQLHAAAYGAIPIGNADVAISHDARVLTLSGALLGSRGNGTVHVRTQTPFAYDADLQVSAGPLAELLAPDTLPASVDVELSAHVVAAGSLQQMAQSSGSIAVPTLALSTRDGLQVRAPHDVALRFVGAQLQFDSIELHSAAGDIFKLHGSLSSDTVDVQAFGDGSLALLPALWPRARAASGAMRFDLALAGAIEHPTLTGQAQCSQCALSFAAPFPEVTHLNVTGFFRGNNLIIDRATADLNGAPASAEGTVLFQDAVPRDYNVRLRVDGLPLAVPSYIASVSSGELTLTGDAALPTLAGDLKVTSARYTQDINWERLLPDIRNKTAQLSSLDTDSEDVRFDVHLMAPRGVVVENNVMDLEAKGDLFLTGTDERPGLLGGLQLLRGTASFRGTRYRIARATVDFVEPYRVIPVLDVVAETRVTDYDVTARIVGPIAAPQVSLASSPQLTEIDIVSLLTFGFTQYDVKDAQGSAGAAGLEVVSAYTGLDAELQRVLPAAVRESSVVAVDELRLTSQFSMRAGASLPALALGMQVNPGVWGIDGSRLRLQSTLIDTTGNGTERRVEWEKRFDNDVRLRLNWTSEDDGTCPSCNNAWGDLGGDVWYRWEF